MPEMKKNGARWEYSHAVTAGVSEVLLIPQLATHKPGSVGVSPGAGGTAKVEFTLSPLAMVKADDASVIWRVWPHGIVSVDTDDVLDGPVTALRISAVTADAEWEVLL